MRNVFRSKILNMEGEIRLDWFTLAPAQNRCNEKWSGFALVLALTLYAKEDIELTISPMSRRIHQVIYSDIQYKWLIKHALFCTVDKNDYGQNVRLCKTF